MATIQVLSGPEIEVALDGDIDISLAAQLKQELLKALDCEREIHVSLEAVSTLDITAFQLLWAAARQARMMGRAFTFRVPLSRDTLAGLIEAGLPCASLLEGDS